MYQSLQVTDKPKKKVMAALWKDLQNTSWKATAVARVVHGKAFCKWTEAHDRTLSEAFAELNAESNYQLATKTERDEAIIKLALLTRRSPAAVKIRLKALGHDLRKTKSAPPKKVDLQHFIAASIAKHTAS